MQKNNNKVVNYNTPTKTKQQEAKSKTAKPTSPLISKDTRQVRAT